MPDQRASLRNGGAAAAKTAATAAAVPNGGAKAEPDAVDAQAKAPSEACATTASTRAATGSCWAATDDLERQSAAVHRVVPALLVLGGLFFGFEAKWLSANLSPAVVAVFAYVWLLAVVNMGVTAWKDPGVISPRAGCGPAVRAGRYVVRAGAAGVGGPGGSAGGARAARAAHPRPDGAGQVVRDVRHLPSATQQPLPSCDNCVENIDHHCTYLNTCIGRRNYVPFLVFLSASIVAALYVVAFTAARLVLMTKPTTYRYPRGGAAEGYSFRQALGESPVSAVLFVLSLAAAAPLVVLWSYHVRLVLRNRSTVEQIRINTARDYGEHKQLELDPAGDDDAASNVRRGGPPTPHRAARRARQDQDRQARYKDPNPFAAARTRTNVRNALGWRSLDLGSWIDRRAVHEPDTRAPHPRPTADAPATEAPVWKA